MTSSYNPSTWETEAGKSEVVGHTWLDSECEASLGYMPLCLKAGGGRGNRESKLGLVVYTCIPSTQEADMRGC